MRLRITTVRKARSNHTINTCVNFTGTFIEYMDARNAPKNMTIGAANVDAKNIAAGSRSIAPNPSVAEIGLTNAMPTAFDNASALGIPNSFKTGINNVPSHLNTGVYLFTNAGTTHMETALT